MFADGSDPNSGVNPAWRKAYVHNIVANGWAPGSSAAMIQAVYDNITYKKVQAMEELAPDTGCYMNEADRFDPDHPDDFYGEHRQRLERSKRKWDPDGVFYCPTCSGSDEWAFEAGGAFVGFPDEKELNR